MERKSNIITLTLLIVLLFASCARIQTKSTESIVSAASEITTAPIVTEITYPQADGYDLFSVGMLNDNTPIIILGTGKEDRLKKIYKMNLSENTSKLIYDGEGRGSSFAIYAKSHPNNTYSIQFENENALIFDAATDQIIKTIDFNQVEGTFFSISNNGKQVVYETREGLCVSDLDMTSETVVYQSGEMSPYWPVFSNDDGRIAFPMAESIGEATTMKKCAIYNLETKESVVFDCSASELFWADGNNGLIACDNNSFIEFSEESSHIWYFNLIGNEKNHLNVEGQITPMGILKQGMLYNHDPRPLMVDGGYRNFKIMLWDYENNDLQELDLGYQFAGIGACSVSQDGNSFLFRASVVIDGEAVPKVFFVKLAN